MEVGISGCVIAGGQSRRMGRDKRFLTLNGKTLIQRTLKVLESLFEDVIVVLATPVRDFEVGEHRVVYDLIPDCGSLGGLYTGLTHARCARVFATAGDMPFLSADVIRYLIRRDQAADVVGVRLESGLQPMHAVYSKGCLPVLQDMATSRHLRIQDLFLDERLHVSIVPEQEIAGMDPDLLSFRNINTPEEYAVAKALATMRDEL